MDTFSIEDKLNMQRVWYKKIALKWLLMEIFWEDHATIRDDLIKNWLRSWEYGDIIKYLKIRWMNNN